MKQKTVLSNHQERKQRKTRLPAIPNSRHQRSSNEATGRRSCKSGQGLKRYPRLWVRNKGTGPRGDNQEQSRTSNGKCRAPRSPGARRSTEAELMSGEYFISTPGTMAPVLWTASLPDHPTGARCKPPMESCPLLTHWTLSTCIPACILRHC